MVESCPVLCTAGGWLWKFLPGLPFGLLLGALFGPLRLAGVDYGKWYRNPGEISEGDDHSWIGLMKATGLTSARMIILGVFVVGVLWLLIAYWAGDDLSVGWPVLGAVIGAIVAAAVVQTIFEGLWHYGLYRGKGQSLQIRLARRPATPPRGGGSGNGEFSAGSSYVATGRGTRRSERRASAPRTV
jgi:hypothetical protein